MEFVHDSQRKTYDLVSAYLSELVNDESLVRNAEKPYFSFLQGSAVVQISILPAADSSHVMVNSWVVTQVTPSAELFEFLLQKNWEFVYASFAIDEEHDIALTAYAYGDTLDQEELTEIVAQVAAKADEYDDVIINRFGGLSAKDRVG